MRVVPFGCAAGRPTATRHVSGLGVDLGSSWILVDCGEGTQQQVMASPLRLSRLELIAITHLHGDHVLGLPGLVSTLSMEQRRAPLTIIGPVGLSGWLEATAATPILEVGFELRIIELDETDAGGPEPMAVELNGPEVTVETLALRHRVPCFGYRLTTPQRPGRVDLDAAAALGVTPGPDLGRLQRGESIVVHGSTIEPDQVLGPPQRGTVICVLGDTTPCAASVRLAAGADLLVHEATYRTADRDLAEQWRHSTAAQAAEVAVAAGARRLVITHFSSRYDDPGLLFEEAAAVAPDVHLAVEGLPIEVPAPDAPPTGVDRSSP